MLRFRKYGVKIWCNGHRKGKVWCCCCCCWSLRKTGGVCARNSRGQHPSNPPGFQMWASPASLIGQGVCRLSLAKPATSSDSIRLARAGSGVSVPSFFSSISQTPHLRNPSVHLDSPAPYASSNSSFHAFSNAKQGLQYLLLLEALLLSAVVIYGALFWLVMPLRLLDKPIFFDYSNRSAAAVRAAPVPSPSLDRSMRSVRSLVRFDVHSTYRSPLLVCLLVRLSSSVVRQPACERERGGVGRG